MLAGLPEGQRRRGRSQMRGTRGRGARGGGNLGPPAGRWALGPARPRPAEPAPSSRHRSPCVPRRPASSARSEGEGRGRALPGPRLAAEAVRPESIFGGGNHPVCPRSRLPPAANQSGPSPRARSDWGRGSSAPGPQSGPPRRPATVYPAFRGHLLLVEAERRPRCNVLARCSETGVAAGRSPWLGLCGARGGRGGPPRRRRSDEKRGVPFTRRDHGSPLPLARRPLLPREGQVFHTDSCDFKDQAIQGLPRKGGNLEKRGERQQLQPWDQPSLRR